MDNLRPILYVEDEENDAFFLQRAFSQAGIGHPLVVVGNGEEAIKYFSGGGRHETGSHELPCLALLDLKMPRKSGLEVLAWIRKESAVATMPVIVLTSSLQNADIHRAYAEGANAYLVKPSQPSDLVSMVKAIKDFWLTHNRFDPEEPVQG